MTTLLRPELQNPQNSKTDGEVNGAAALPLLTLVAGVAVCKAARQLGAADARLKWPNDIVVQDRKLGGILLETEGIGTGAPFVMVGIGLNLAPTAALKLPEELTKRYLGLADLVIDFPTGPQGPQRALPAVLKCLQACYRDWCSGNRSAILEWWRGADALQGTRVRVQSGHGPVEGVAQGITDQGHLRVSTAKGMVQAAFGEVERVQ